MDFRTALSTARKWINNTASTGAIAFGATGLARDIGVDEKTAVAVLLHIAKYEDSIDLHGSITCPNSDCGDQIPLQATTPEELVAEAASYVGRSCPICDRTFQDQDEIRLRFSFFFRDGRPKDGNDVTPNNPLLPARAVVPDRDYSIAEAKQLVVNNYGTIFYGQQEGGVTVNNPSSGGDRKSMATREHTRAIKLAPNPWRAGSFYLVAGIAVVLCLIAAAKWAPYPIYTLPLIVIGAVILISVVNAFQLRNDERLSQRNFLALVGLAMKQLALFKWLNRGATSQASDGEKGHEEHVGMEDAGARR